jgi:hypothetical protein
MINDLAYLFILKDNDKIIGMVQIVDINIVKDIIDFESKGADMYKKGLYLTSLCGDANYNGVTKPLFDEIDKYAKNNNYKYALYILTLNGLAIPEIGASNSFSGIE